jgi:hypothetical protein
MKQTLLLIPVLLLLVISCTSNENTDDTVNNGELVSTSENLPTPKTPFTPNSRLLNFSISIVNTIGDMESRDSVRYKEIFSKYLVATTDTIRYLKQRIYISCIKPAGGCAEYKGDLVFRNDTIVLLLKNISEISCAEIEEWRVIYEIENKDNKKYVIRKQQ